ncbi:MAG: bacteriohemerythrin [Treponema sp.]|jgi:hemerythrin-like metal-binding protein|nr:bacteriohemerythrin [Treponema sp.]
MAQLEFIVWQQNYSVGNKEIDSQHKELMNFVNDAIGHSTGNKKAESDYFSLVIKPGIIFLQKHFDTEQAAMLAQNYEGYQSHKTEHDKMIETLTRISDDVLAGRQALNLLEIALFIRDWFLNHIQEFDQKAKDCFKYS